MTPIRDKYQIEETTTAFSFKPFYHYRKKLFWYVVAMMLFAGFTYYFLDRESEVFLVIGFTLLFVTIWFFLKELLIYIPIKYTFNIPENTVYQSNLFFKNRKIMALDEVTIFQSSDMGSWRYKMGKKKKQFVKNYTISENFSDKKNDEALNAFETEILDKIEQMINPQDGIAANHSGFRIHR